MHVVTTTTDDRDKSLFFRRGKRLVRFVLRDSTEQYDSQ